MKNILAVAGLLLVAGGVFLYLNFGDMVKRKAEQIASDAAGTSVRLSDLDASYENKKVTVSGIQIFNLPGYKTSHAVVVDKVDVVLESFSKELIVFKSVDVVDTNINLEVKEKTTNLTDLKNRAASRPKKESTQPQPKVIIRSLNISNSQIVPKITLLGREVSKPIQVPSVRLTGVGQRENGILARDAVKQILTQYLNVATKEANKQGLLNGMDPAALKDIKGQLNMTGIEKAKDDIKELKEGIKGLFGD